MTITLKGMTWSHPRGYDPMVACSRLWHEKTGVTVTWDKRSLQDFETYPVEELAKAYDLIVIDHPHVGQITAEGCLAPLDVAGREAERKALQDGSVGGSYRSYQWQGHQWAFPIDAATQVQAVIPGKMENPPSHWNEVLELARLGRVLIPLRSPHSLMTFYTLCANMGAACRSENKGLLIEEKAGVAAFEMMRELVGLVDPECFDMDPIAVLEEMSFKASPIACSPLIYGYVSYSMDGFRQRRVQFTDIAAAGSLGPAGSALGGTGIAVSAFSHAIPQAVDFAYWIASGSVQAGPYADAGGQPGHAQAWEDGGVNAASSNFYRGTRNTLDAAWIRPRHDGYMSFQSQASEVINQGLKSGTDAAIVVGDINRLFLASYDKA